MNNFTLKHFFKLVLNLLLFIFVLQANAQNAALRRPITPNSPMWLIHIDTWNYADPQKIIDLIPLDIRPYVVMNISLSISHDVTTSQFKVAEYGYEIAKSWVRICAENQMWVMIQPSSGGYTQFSDSDLSVYEEFYTQYPNFIGFNYAEQFWGFGDANDPLSPTWTTRMNHFANLLKLSNQYGGYLSVSWCGNQYSPSINPMAMLKLNPNFATACKNYTENFILSEKYTQQAYQSDMESLCLGSYLSGFSGNYGIRYDDTGWTDTSGTHNNFTMATAGAPHLEHAMLTGQTVIDGPELIWTQCFRETNRIASSNGYTSRNWETFPQFENVSVDLFRKIVDGTVRIPTRREVIDRTKVVVINNVNSGTQDDIYSTPTTLFNGLYTMDGDGNLLNNKTFFKKSGRYPTIPTVFQLDDTDAKSFQVQVNKTDYNTRWSTISAKTTELNTLFPQEYTGDLYAGRHENGWVVYNPYKTGQIASANIPFKYNTCSSMDLTFSQYTSGVVKETANQLKFYLNNYDNVIDTTLKTDIIKINGCNSEPNFSFLDRANHQSSDVTTSWSGGVYTLTVKHNGALDITVDCSGSATGRLTNYTNATLLNHKNQLFTLDLVSTKQNILIIKNVSKVVTGGKMILIRNYTGQGYITFGTNAAASVRDEIHALRKGTYQLKIRYSAPDVTVTSVDLYINGNKVATPTFTKTADASTWNVYTQNVNLNTGNNEIRLEANTTGSGNINFDNIVFTQNSQNDVYHFTDDVAKTVASTPAAELVTVKSGSAGVVSFTDANNVTSNAFKTYSVGTTNGTAVADLDLFSKTATNYSITWKEYSGTTGGKKGILLRATGANGSCAYADGMKQGYLFIVLNNSDGTTTLKPFIAGTAGITEKTNYTSTFTAAPNKPIWFRATAIENKLIFECSLDGINWEGGSQTTFQDSTYTTGSTEVVWGLNSNNFNWVMDDIAYSSANVSVSKFVLNGFTYVKNSGPTVAQSFNVFGSSLAGNIIINAPASYEISLNSANSYSSSISLTPTSGAVLSTPIFVRLKSGLSVGVKEEVITVVSQNTANNEIKLSGEVTPEPIFKKYDFTNDVSSTTATTPPAINATIGASNSATAGVVSYTDINNLTSNVLKPYGVGQKSATGVIDLNAFSAAGTDYSVTWKQYIGSDTSQYKVGVLLRGDNTKVGDATTGYVQGIKQGYLFIVYNTGTSSEFRIYQSTSGGLNMLMNTSVGTLDPASKQPILYRASVSGTTITNLKFEYSTDNGTNWKTGATVTDNNSPYQSGSTQIVWGLAVNSLDFYMDDISFSGFDTNSKLDVDDFEQNYDAFVISTQYYNLLGQKLSSIENASGYIIIKMTMSDGTIKTKKIYKNY